MSDLDAAGSIFPIHIEETIQSIVRLHAGHRESAVRHQRAVNRFTSLLGHPFFLGP